MKSYTLFLRRHFTAAAISLTVALNITTLPAQSLEDRLELIEFSIKSFFGREYQWEVEERIVNNRSAIDGRINELRNTISGLDKASETYETRLSQLEGEVEAFGAIPDETLQTFTVNAALVANDKWKITYSNFNGNGQPYKEYIADGSGRAFELSFLDSTITIAEDPIRVLSDALRGVGTVQAFNALNPLNGLSGVEVVGDNSVKFVNRHNNLFSKIVMSDDGLFPVGYEEISGNGKPVIRTEEEDYGWIFRIFDAITGSIIQDSRWELVEDRISSEDLSGESGLSLPKGFMIKLPRPDGTFEIIPVDEFRREQVIIE